MARLIYEKRDLFSMPHGYCFAHCISSDFALGAGIAKEIDERYNMKSRLKSRYGVDNDSVGSVFQVDNVFNLVTKRHCYEKPKYQDLNKTLKNLAEIVRDDKITKLAMPKIGAGLDKLKWTIVLSLIKDAFSDLDVEITICFLEDDPDYLTTVNSNIKSVTELLNEDKTEDNEEDYDYEEDIEDDRFFI